MEDYFAANKHKWEERSKVKYKQAVRHAFLYKPGLKLSEVDQAFMVGLVQWHIDNGYSNTTTNSKISALKTLFRWGKNNGYPINEELFKADTSIREHKKRVIFLHYDELMQLYNFRFPAEYEGLKKYRDMFAFMCFTGLRYCDMIGLKKSDLLESGYISIYTEKTEDFLKIPLLSKAKEILKQYTGNPGEYVFPQISNQKVNDNIKEVAKLVGLDREVVETKYVGKRKHEERHPLYETLGCHDARKTFVCCSIKFGIPATVVMKMTGHSDYDAMQPYNDVADDTVKVEMLKWEADPIRSQIISALDSATPEQMKKALKILSSKK